MPKLFTQSNVSAWMYLSRTLKISAKAGNTRQVFVVSTCFCVPTVSDATVQGEIVKRLRLFLIGFAESTRIKSGDVATFYHIHGTVKGC